MKLTSQISTAFALALALTSCASKTGTTVNQFWPDQPLPKKADPAQFPKFRLVAEYDDFFSMISDEGKPLLVSSNNWISMNEDRGQLTEICEKYMASSLGIYNTELKRTTSDRNFLDSKGKLRTYLDHDPIQVEDKGKKVAIIPIDVPSDDYRYYSGRSGIFVSKISDGVIRKIFDREMGWLPIFRNEALYFSSTDPNGKSQIVKVGPNCPLTVVLQDPPSYLAAVGPNEELGFGRFGFLGDYSIKFPGKPLVKIPGNDFGLSFYPSGKGVFPVGTAYAIQGGIKTNYVAMYAPDGSYVPLRELCPELKTKMVHLDDVYNNRYGYAKSGYLAIEISGAVKDASAYNSPHHVSTPWMEGTRITKTYILKEIR